MPFPRWGVALPARNEARRLPGALEALDLAARQACGAVRVTVLADRCIDATTAAARDAATRLRHIRVRVVLRENGLETVGAARAAACEYALDGLGEQPGALLLTTDADARVHEETFARMEQAFAQGADLCCARLDPVADPFDSASPAAIRRARADAARRALIRRLAARRTPGCGAPCLHDDYGGAGLAFTGAAYRRLGGFAPVSRDEDRRLARLAERAGLTIDRTSRARVAVLARRKGRAPGGMAAALAEAEAGGDRQVERAGLTLERLGVGEDVLDVIEARPAQLEPIADALAGLRQALRAPRRALAA
ncbi:MAG: glycosyltransferase [Oceanicaulis sp.]